MVATGEQVNLHYRWWGSDWQNTIGWVWNDQARWIFLRADGLVWQWVCGNAEVGD